MGSNLWQEAGGRQLGTASTTAMAVCIHSPSLRRVCAALRELLLLVRDYQVDHIKCFPINSNFSLLLIHHMLVQKVSTECSELYFKSAAQTYLCSTGSGRWISVFLDLDFPALIIWQQDMESCTLWFISVWIEVITTVTTATVPCWGNCLWWRRGICIFLLTGRLQLTLVV